MTKAKRSFRCELDQDLATRFKQKLMQDGYKSYAEWLRERIRHYLRETDQ
jgi:metal-responsive CopG/Arc/MetJ family transcriptional regulator